MSAAAKLRSDFDKVQSRKSLPYFDILKLKGRERSGDSIVVSNAVENESFNDTGNVASSSSTSIPAKSISTNSLSYDHITTRDVVKAFRRESLSSHPDKPTGDAKQFQEVNRAYQCLKDPERRSRYIQFGFDENNISSGSMDQDDFIDAFFGETARTVDGLSADWKLHSIGNYLLLDPMAEDFPIYLRDIVRIGLNYLASLDFLRFENVFFLRHARVDCLFLMLGIIEGTDEWQRKQRKLKKLASMGRIADLKPFNPSGTNIADLKGGHPIMEGESSYSNVGLQSNVENVVIEGQHKNVKSLLDEEKRQGVANQRSYGDQKSSAAYDSSKSIDDDLFDDHLLDQEDADLPFYLTQDIFESEYSYSITYYDTPLQPGIQPRWSDQNVLGHEKEKRLGENYDKQRERRELNFEEFERRTKYALAMLEDETQKTGIDEMLKLEEQHYNARLEDMKVEHQKKAVIQQGTGMTTTVDASGETSRTTIISGFAALRMESASTKNVNDDSTKGNNNNSTKDTLVMNGRSPDEESPTSHLKYEGAFEDRGKKKPNVMYQNKGRIDMYQEDVEADWQ